MKLTDKICRAARPGDVLTHDGEYGAGRLQLVVSPKGRKSFVLRVRAGGKNTSKVLGHYPETALAEALHAARRGLPAEHATPVAGVVTTGSLTDLLDAYRRSLGERPTARDVRIQFVLAFKDFPALLEKPAAQVTTADVAGVLRAKAATGATTSVNRLRAGLHAAFAYAAKYDYDPRRVAGAVTFGIGANPVTGTPRVAEWERAKSRVLTDAEIRAFVAAAAARNDGVGDLWRLVLMTGARLSQLVEANFAADTITISDAKGRGSRVKLCVLPVVEAMRPLVARAALVRALHIDTVRKAGAAMLPEDATPNDIRRTVETRLQGLGVSREMRGALLSHGNGGVQARHYEHGDLLPQKAAVLAAWAAEIQRLAMLK